MEINHTATRMEINHTATRTKPVIVRQVWRENLEFEFSLLNRAGVYHPLVSMDTEFPGTIFQPTIDRRYFPDYPFNYSLMKDNVNALNIIQLGITLSDYHGNMPSFGTGFSYVWEFNFRDFDIDRDLYNVQSIDLLKQQGIDFKKNKEKGIDSRDFANLFLNSGLLSNKYKLTWIAFHGAYDFGFLIKILARQPLPPKVDTFMTLVATYFGYNVYDVKYMIRSGGLHGGLEKVAELLHVERQAGKSHQAGSDSLLIMQTFLKFTSMISTEYKEEAITRFKNFRRQIYG